MDLGLTWAEMASIAMKGVNKVRKEKADDGKISPAEGIEVVGLIAEEIGKACEPEFASLFAAGGDFMYAIAEQMGEPLDD